MFTGWHKQDTMTPKVVAGIERPATANGGFVVF
jgi:hypothetical protein